MDIRRVHDESRNESERVDDDMSLPSFYFLSSIVAVDPLFSVVFTD